MPLNVLLCPNLDKENGLLCTQRTAQMLTALGAVPMLDVRLRERIGEQEGQYGSFTQLLRRCDVLMPIGGDGTMLRAARYAVAADKPVLAVNAGRVGFLAQVETHELEQLRLLVEGKYTTFQRMLLEAELQQKGKPRHFLALNDVVVGRGGKDKIVDLEVRQGDRLIARHRADGLIFSTPTGSTAYSLSAGGPIVDPEMSLLVMTAICSHSTFDRSVILPDAKQYTVTESLARNAKGLAVWVDGRKMGTIDAGETLLVRKATVGVRFIDLGLHSFYDRVNTKLSWGR